MKSRGMQHKNGRTLVPGKGTSPDDYLYLKTPTTVLPYPIKQSIVPASFFPRYEYALENFTDIKQRYKNVFCQTQRRKLLLRNVALYFCKSDDESDFPLNVHDVVSTDTLTESMLEKNVYIKNNRLSTEQSSLFSVFVVTKNMKNIISCASGKTLVAIVARSEQEASAISRQYCSNRFVSTIRRMTAGKQIDMQIERAMFHAFTPLCETLNQYTASRKIHEQTANRKRKIPITKIHAPYKVLKKKKQVQHRNHLTQCHPTRNDKILSEIYEQNMVATKQAERRNGERSRPKLANLTGDLQQISPWLEVNEERILSVDNQVKECLLEELLGVYNMSDVPDSEMPNIPKDREQLDLDAVKDTIFAADPAITGVGYRYGTLQFVVEEGNSSRNIRHIRDNIREALHQNTLEEFQIVPMSLKKYLKAGDEINVEGARASFGCFAEMRDDNGPKLCGLLSKHFAARSDKIFVKNGDKKVPIGEVLRETVTDQGLDIAAAKLNINQRTCDTRFRSSRGRPKTTGRGRFRSLDKLKGHKVHLWGARSKPGKGIITDPDFKYMGNSVIQVEDIVDGEHIINERFSQKGDSGAVICVDDPTQDSVHPVSMNMGCLNFKHVENDNKNSVRKVRGRYMTVPLSSGLKELQDRTGKVFDLC